MSSTDTGRPGDRTKLKVLSDGIGSVPALTTPRMLASATVTGKNVTEAEAFGAIVTERVSISWPSSSNRTGSVGTGVVPRLVTSTVTVARAPPRTGARAKSAVVIATLDGPGVATEIGVSVAPSGR